MHDSLLFSKPVLNIQGKNSRHRIQSALACVCSDLLHTSISNFKWKTVTKQNHDQRWWCMPPIPALGRTRKYCEFKASLASIANKILSPKQRNMSIAYLKCIIGVRYYLWHDMLNICYSNSYKNYSVRENMIHFTKKRLRCKEIQCHLVIKFRVPDIAVA